MVNDTAHYVNDPLHDDAGRRWWRWRHAGAVAIMAAIGVGCGTPDPAPAANASDDAVLDADASAGQVTAELVVIGPDGIGAARSGMTVAEIRTSLGAGLALGDVDDRFMVDLVAIPVHRGAETLYFLVFPAADMPGEGAVPLFAVTDHPSVRTSEGIGPGSTLAEAAVAYGQPTLRFSADDEMREYATFPGYPHPTVFFRVAPGETAFLAGRYGEQTQSGETGDFDGDARIMMVLVELRRY
jgi:hypothetical protein